MIIVKYRKFSEIISETFFSFYEIHVAKSKSSRYWVKKLDVSGLIVNHIIRSVFVIKGN